jgi:6-phosphogluconolactonase
VTIRIVKTPVELFQLAATEFAARASAAVRANGRFTIALSGGSTPKGLYGLLASGSVASIPWDKIYFFWGDERHVPPDHPESNYRMAYEALLSRVPVPKENVFRIRGEERDAEMAATAYEQDLQEFFGLKPSEFPRFDLVLLGLGPDGHTASLFPDSAALTERRRLVVANWVEKFKTHRITLTLPVLSHAACVMFLVSGPEKAPVVKQIFENPDARLPAQEVRPADGELLWLMDQAAAGDLAREPGERG